MGIRFCQIDVRQDVVTVAFVLIGSFLCFFFPELSVWFLTPFFALTSSSACGSADSNCGNCSCNGQGGQDPVGGNPGDPVGGGSSTPFLAVYRNNQYELENDVMYAKRTNYFLFEDFGRRIYQEGLIVPELYKLSSPPEVSGGKIKMKLLEIEPEESFVDAVKLKKAYYPASSELVVDATFKKLWAIDKKELRTNHGIEQLELRGEQGRDYSELTANLEEKLSTLDSRRQVRHLMKDGDVIECVARVKSGVGNLLLIIGSSYRDWALPDYATPITSARLTERTAGSILSPLSGKFSRALAAVLLLPLWLAGSVLAVSRGQQLDGLDLAKSFGIPKASADVPPKCFNVEYWDGLSYRPITFVQPRYFQMTLEAVAVPQEAIDANGEVRLRITATKAHSLSHVGLVSPSQTNEVRTEVASLSHAYHERTGSDVTNTLRQTYSGSYVHTIPSDTVNLEFNEPSAPRLGEESSYVISVEGFYTSLTPESKNTAGDWENKLDAQSQNWLSEMVSMRYKSDSRPMS